SWIHRLGETTGDDLRRENSGGRLRTPALGCAGRLRGALQPWVRIPRDRHGWAVTRKGRLWTCGEGGIRTRGRLLTYARLASGYLRPLGHLSDRGNAWRIPPDVAAGS